MAISISELKFTNFKCFKDEGIPFTQLTVLTGTNGSGKSSAIQPLLLICQSMLRGSLQQLSLQGPLLKIESASELLTDGTPSRSEKIKFEFVNYSESLKITFAPTRSSIRGLAPILKLERKGKTGRYHALEKRVENAQENCSRPQVERSEVLNSLAKLTYLAADRGFSSSLFSSPRDQPVFAMDAGPTGCYAAWCLAQFGDEPLPKTRLLLKDRSGRTLRQQTVAWLTHLFGFVDVNARKLDEKVSQVLLELRNAQTGAWRTTGNMGYGITYVLPIVVAGLVAKAGTILVVDSPEAHLHPGAQSRIGQFLALLATTGVQIIVETHSDHVINGIRLAVSKGTPCADVSFLRVFQSPQHGLAEIDQITVDQEGRLSHWPTGFFDQITSDLSQL